MTHRQTQFVILLVGITLVALAGAGLVGAVDGGEAHPADSPPAFEPLETDDDLVEPCAAEPPADFADPEDGNDTIGWFDGYWYNEPLDIDAEGGLTEDELEEVSARTAARFETMRCLTFDSLPPVEIMDRETFAEETEAQFEGIDDQTRQFENAQFEAMLLIGSDEDAVDVQQADRTAVVGGYYDFIDDEVVVISDDPDQLQLDEAILAHELGHALQNQHFGLADYDRPTRDIDNGKLGVIEGDVHRVEQEYLEYCELDLWNEPCILDDSSAEETAQEPPNWGLYFMQFQPYSDGPNFVDHIYEEDGWDGVNDLYEDMPRSSVEVIYPEEYGEFEAADLEVEDRSSDDWERLTVEGGPDYNELGQAGLSAMFMDQSYEAAAGLFGDEAPIIPQDEFFNLDDPTNPLNYDLDETRGWEGDRLYAYDHDDGNSGVVWKQAWADEDELATFASTYEQLIELRGGERVDGTAHTWTFDDDSDFDMAMTLYPDDDRLWIVTAPTTDELTEIHDIDILEEGDTPIVTDDEADDDESAGDDAGDDTDDETADDADTVPGFAASAAIVALSVSLMLATRKRRVSDQ